MWLAAARLLPDDLKRCIKHIIQICSCSVQWTHIENSWKNHFVGHGTPYP